MYVIIESLTELILYIQNVFMSRGCVARGQDCLSIFSSC